VREGIVRFGEPQAVAASPIMIVAAVGVAINLARRCCSPPGASTDIKCPRRLPAHDGDAAGVAG